MAGTCMYSKLCSNSSGLSKHSYFDLQAARPLVAAPLLPSYPRMHHFFNLNPHPHVPGYLKCFRCYFHTMRVTRFNGGAHCSAPVMSVVHRLR